MTGPSSVAELQEMPFSTLSDCNILNCRIAMGDGNCQFWQSSFLILPMIINYEI